MTRIPLRSGAAMQTSGCSIWPERDGRGCLTGRPCRRARASRPAVWATPSNCSLPAAWKSGSRAATDRCGTPVRFPPRPCWFSMALECVASRAPTLLRSGALRRLPSCPLSPQRPVVLRPVSRRPRPDRLNSSRAIQIWGADQVAPGRPGSSELTSPSRDRRMFGK